MSLRPADLRFLVGHPVRTVTVLSSPHDPTLRDVATAFTQAGVEVRPPGTSPVDLVVAAAAAAPEALRLSASSHLFDGRPAAQLVRRGGRTAHELLAVRHEGRLATVLPVQDRRAVRHYVRRMAAPSKRVEQVAKVALRSLASVGLPVAPLLSTSRVMTLVGEARGRSGRSAPRLLQVAAAELGLPNEPSWVLSLGRGDDLQRAVFHVIEDEGLRWVVKFGRHPAVSDAFDRDALGLSFTRDAGGVAAAHAPSLLGRLEVDGLPASVESAARGRGLHLLMDRRPLPLVEQIASWIVDLGEQTRVPPPAMGPELDRLRDQVLPAWLQVDSTRLLAAVAELPGVLQHNDLGCWNILADRGRREDDFTVVDWESARAVGLPLWDLVYFLGDALPRLEGAADNRTLLRRCVDVFAGRSTYSPVLFKWVGIAVERLGIPKEAAGSTITLSWLHHGLSTSLRREALAGAVPAPPGHLSMMAEPWLRDAALGPAWRAWRAWSG